MPFNSSQLKSPTMEKSRCKVCGKDFTLFLSHLKRSNACGAQYDVASLEAEEQRQRKERMTAYNKDHREEINANMRKNYKFSAKKMEKKKAMTAYNEEHRKEINAAMKTNYKDAEKKEAKKKAMTAYDEQHREARYLARREKLLSEGCSAEFECPICEKKFWYKKSIYKHLEHFHSDTLPSFRCQICDKNFGYKDNLETHMKEVHGGVKYSCDKCPAAFARNMNLVSHINRGWHYLSFFCKQCQKTLVFKHLVGLIEHVIVKQSVGEAEFEGIKYKKYQSGILVTCKSHVKSTQLKEGEHVLCMPKKDKVIAENERVMKKEEIINDGLKSVMGNPEAPQVKLEFELKKHEDDGRRKCKWCFEHMPYSTEFCSCRYPGHNWQLQRD